MQTDCCGRGDPFFSNSRGFSRNLLFRLVPLSLDALLPPPPFFSLLLSPLELEKNVLNMPASDKITFLLNWFVSPSSLVS